MAKQFHILYILLLLPCMIFAQQAPNIDAVLKMPANEQKFAATLLLLKSYNTNSVKLDALVTQNLAFTNTRQYAQKKAALLIENAFRYFNAGNLAASKLNLATAEAHISKFKIADGTLRAKTISLNILYGDNAKASALLGTGIVKTRGVVDIGALIAYADTWYRLKNIKSAAALLNEAGMLLNIDSTAQEETGHLLSQLIIQSIRLKQYKNIEKYYTALRRQVGYRFAQEYILAQGLYFSYKKQDALAEVKLRVLAKLFINGQKNEHTLEAVIRLAAILSRNKKTDLANNYFHLANLSLNKNLRLQPVGIIYNELYREHLLKNDAVNKTILDRTLVADSAYILANEEALQALKYRYDLLVSKQNIELLELQKTKTRQNNLIFTLLGILLLLAAFTLVYVFYQRRKRTILLYQADKERTEHRHKIELNRLLANAQETERSKIAEKLHDEIGSMLAVVRLNLSNETNKDVVPTKEQLHTATKVLNDVADTVREMSHELMPVLIHKMGLKAAIEQLVEDINTAGKLKIESVFIGVKEIIDPYGYEFKVNVYRIIQELFHNILKHAQASQVVFQMIQHPDALNILVEDNGIGMGNKDIEGKGLLLIKARINSYQGAMSIESNAKSGTMIIIDIPLQNTHSAI